MSSLEHCWILMYWPQGIRKSIAPDVIGTFESHKEGHEHRELLFRRDRLKGWDPVGVVTLIEPPKQLPATLPATSTL